MTVNLFYELGSGMEPQREFEYVKVTDGMGIYKWTDYNGDGLEQLDEFEIAEYQDEANYIRVYTNTINYLKTNKNNLNLSVRIKPRELLNSENEFWADGCFRDRFSQPIHCLKTEEHLSGIRL